MLIKILLQDYQTKALDHRYGVADCYCIYEGRMSETFCRLPSSERCHGKKVSSYPQIVRAHWLIGQDENVLDP